MTQHTDDQINSFFNCVEVYFVCVSGFVHVFPQSQKFRMPASEMGDCFIIIEFHKTDGDLLQGAETPNC